MEQISKFDINSLGFAILCNFPQFCGEERAKEAADILRKMKAEIMAYRASGLTPDELARAAELFRAEREGRLTVQSPPAKEGEPKPQCFYNDNYGLWCLGMSHEGDDEPTDYCKQCWYCESGNYADLRAEAEKALGGGGDG